MEQIELTWKKYKLEVQLFRSYLDLVIKINLFYYIVTGAIISYYLANKSEQYIIYSLLLPMLMSFSLCAYFIYAAVLAENARKSIRGLAFELKQSVYPEARILVFLIIISAINFAFVFISLLTWLILQVC